MGVDMKEIHIVTAGDYSDYTIYGVFSTQEKAQAYIDSREWSYNDPGIESYDVDELAPPKGKHLFQVYMERDGTASKIEKAGSWDDPEVKLMPIRNILMVVCWARDEIHAAKIAGERRREFIASGVWK